VRSGSGAAAEASARRLGPRLAEALLLAGALAGAAALLAALTHFEYGLDQGIYAVVSDAILHGGAPYRDAWDFKPPGIFYVYALARGLLGPGMASVRWVEAAGFATLPLAFGLYSRRFAGGWAPGLLGAALAVSGHVWLGFWQTAQPESFGAVLVAWAIVLASVEPDAGSSRRTALAWATSGAAYAAAGLLKPPLGGGILVSAGLAARAARRAGGPRAALRPLVAFGAGALVPVAAVALHLAARGALGDLREALLGFAPGYTELNYGEGTPLVFAFRAVEFALFRFSLLNPLGLALLFALPPLAPREREGVVHVLGVGGVLLAGVALQARFFPYHFGAVLPLAALLAGWGLWKLVRVGRQRALGVAAVAVLVLLLANANGWQDPVPGGFVERVRAVQDGHASNAPNRRVAAWLAAHTAPDDAIYVWGFDPLIYDLARRRPASRFVYNAAQRAPWYRRRARAALMRDLRRTPPAAILVQRGDVEPGTAGTERDSAAELRHFPELAALIRDRYRLAETLAGFAVHLRRPEPEGATSPSAPAPPPGTASRPGSADRAPSP
jgi:hypothetical protein